MKFSDWWLKRALIPKEFDKKQVSKIQQVARDAYNAGVREGKKINEDHKQMQSA